MANPRVRIIWSDLNGLAHGRYIPASRIEEHGHHAVTTLSMGVNREILPVAGYSADVGFPDLTAHAIAGTRRTGWEPDTDVVIADLTYGGQPLALCPRHALGRAVDAWHELGFEPMLGFELEFYVLQADASAPGGWAPLDNPSHRVYGTGMGGDTTGVLLDLFDACQTSNLHLEGVAGEFHPGQAEVNLRYGPALEAADRVFVFKEMARELAAVKGHKITFLGRPHPAYVGTGLHINLSMAPLGGEGNLFDDPGAEHGLAPIARQSIAGLIAHHEAITALSAPLVNSYKRLMPGLIAGYWANWGLDNRISTYRVPGERGPSTRIENRMPCGSASPYLAAAAMLHAARLGVVGGLDCGAPQVGDADSEPNTDRHTPHSLSDALDALEADRAIGDAMGADLVRTFLTIKRTEWERWSAAVTDWELREYLPFY